MKEKKVEPIYNGSEVDFPIVTGMMCHSCLTNLKAFAGHKPKYTKEFVQDIIDRSKAASLIPNIEQRQSHSTSLNKVVADAAGICANNSLTLSSYIESAFSEQEIPAMKKMAGGTWYNTARRNWSDASAMNGMMLTFIDNYNTDLTNAGMPASFPGKCSEDGSKFSTALDTYEEYKGLAEQQRQQKVNASNEVYKSLKSMMKDGKFIYRNDEALRKQFTYSAVLAKVSKNSRSGFTIKINAPEAGKTVTTAELRLNGYINAYKASAKGIISVKIPEGTYNGVITAPGFLPLAVTFISDKGITHREEVTLSRTVAIAV